MRYAVVSEIGEVINIIIAENKDCYVASNDESLFECGTDVKIGDEWAK